MRKRVLDDLPQLMQDAEFRQAYASLEQEFSVAKALLQARAEAKLTQADVAGRMGVTQSTIARIESGRNVSVKTIARYAQAVGQTIRLEIHPA